MKVKTLALPLVFLVVLIGCLQIPIAVNAVLLPTPPPPASLLWWDPSVNTNDLALSKDGRYVAVASSSGVQFYDRTSGMPKTPMWTYSAGGAFFSVAISADGNCVAAGNGSLVCFWKNAKSSAGTPTWTSQDLYGVIQYRCLAISDDGDYLVAGGTGPTVFYWKGAKGKSGPNIATTWQHGTGANVDAVDISSDGNYVAAGTDKPSVAYWKNAESSTGTPDWVSTKLNSALHVVDVAVSDDGNYVVAASHSITGAVYYWAGAIGLSDDPETKWYEELWAGQIFTSVDMSSDGNSVIAGASVGVYFWGGARTLTGKPQSPSWTYPTSTVCDVAIDAAGDYMAAANSVVEPHFVYFLDSNGNSSWNPPYQVDNPVRSLSISSDGGTLAIGTGGPASAHLVSTGFSTPSARPVGGLLIPADKLALLSPWIAVALAAVALTVFATKRRRKA